MRRAILTVVALTATWLAMMVGVWAQPPGPGPGPGGPAGGRGGPFDPARFPLMTAMDADGDGELSPEEIANSAQALKQLDRNQDGKLTPDELRPAFGGRGGPDGRFGREPGGRGGAGGRFGSEPRGGPGGPGGPLGRDDLGRGEPGGPGGRSRSTGLDTPTLAKDDAEQKILDTLQEMARTQGRMMNVPDSDGRLLRLLVQSIGAKNVVEYGTSNGVSAIWMSAALRKTGGRLITHEIDRDVAALARENFAAAGVADIVTVVEGDAHKKLADLSGPIDLVFVDADKEGYFDYLTKTVPLVRPGGLIVAHNVDPGRGNPDFLRAITTSPDLETIFYTEGGGASVTLKK